MRRAALALTLVIPGSALVAPIADATTKVPTTFLNCTALQQYYPHGLAKAGAKDHVKNPKADKPVTNFTVNTSAYTKAYNANHKLDEDHDGVACEKH